MNNPTDPAAPTAALILNRFFNTNPYIKPRTNLKKLIFIGFSITFSLSIFAKLPFWQIPILHFAPLRLRMIF